MTARVVVMTKDAVPGRVKTRMIPRLGADGAARLHALLVDHCLDVCTRSGLPVTVAIDGDADALAARLADRDIRVEAQASGDLGDRLRHALRGPQRVVCVGTDCPDLSPELLQAAAAGRGVTLGPALDGGYWLVAFDGAPDGRAPAGHALFEDIPWSTSTVLATTLDRARAAGLSVTMLPTLRDLDTPDDLSEYTPSPACSSALRDFLARH